MLKKGEVLRRCDEVSMSDGTFRKTSFPGAKVGGKFTNYKYRRPIPSAPKPRKPKATRKETKRDALKHHLLNIIKEAKSALKNL